MSTLSKGRRMFEAWRRASAPFDQAAGRARFIEAFAARLPISGVRPGRPLLQLAGSVTIAAALILSIVWWHTLSPLTFRTGSDGRESDGRAGAWLATSQADELPLTFSEGTRVVLAADSRGRVDQLARTGAIFLLERGRVRAHVVHRASTSWRFVAGPFEVQVTGTALAVDWDPQRERLAVQVDEGSVRVVGPNQAVQVVDAGERWSVDVHARTTRMTSTRDETAANPGVAEVADGGGGGDADVEGGLEASVGAHPLASSASFARPEQPSWSALEERGDYDAAYSAARAMGFASLLRTGSADDLLRLAQVGRVSGHRDSERDALLACRRRFAGSEQAAVAAFELGRGSEPEQAARWFATYVREDPSGPLAREASGRLVEALASSGDSAAAREAATRYLSRYPDGPHAALARGVLSGGP